MDLHAFVLSVDLDHDDIMASSLLKHQNLDKFALALFCEQLCILHLHQEIVLELV